MEMKLELVGVPVTDIDRAKEFYIKLGFNADQDNRVSEPPRTEVRGFHLPACLRSLILNV
jgi:catechol 2,3-dioxygenase-like lactoylglutathione lyase family enzyme